MHDLNFIRENPKQFDSELKRRGIDPKSAKIIELDNLVRNAKTELQALLQEKNTLLKK